MITQLQLHNWRSLQNVTIKNMTPITVLVGANSSGKTNIVDSLDFVRTAISKDTLGALYVRGGREQVHSFGIDDQEPISVAFSFNAEREQSELTFTVSLERNQSATQFVELLVQNPDLLWLRGKDGIGQIRDKSGNLQNAISSQYNSVLAAFGRRESMPTQIQDTFTYLTTRWQILGENFMPPSRVNLFDAFSLGVPDLYVVDRASSNVPYILEVIRKEKPDVYSDLLKDVKWLLDHVESVGAERDAQNLRLVVKEAIRPELEVPTISAGTLRILAMLTAYYALDMRNAEQPGLVVIEEPDTAIHPLLLRNFVDLLRQYVSDEKRPRQFILTTHNPQLLNLFKPEEVRIVERDEHGYTTVKEVDKAVADVWYEKYGEYSLGEIWTTRLLGGVPE